MADKPRHSAKVEGMTRRAPGALGLLLLGVVPPGLLACSSRVPDDDQTGSVEIFSWWTDWGEADALESIIELHEETHPECSVVNAAVDFADKAREQLQARMEAGTPPDLFQANAGADLFKWVLLNGTDDADARVEDLTALADERGWLREFDADVLAAASVDGKLYGLPVNVHRINSLFYRKDLFETYGLSPPTSTKELIALCEVIEETPELQEASATGAMACLGLGNKWNWTLPMVTFEMIFPAVAGPEHYEEFWLGKKSPTDDALTEALDLALTLYCGGPGRGDACAASYFNEDIGDADWDVGVRALVDGRAMMAPMGDWAKGYLEAQGLVPERDFGVVPFPGSRGTFVMTADTFGLPKGASNRRGAIALLDTLASVEGQIAFNRLKGSVSPRLDIPESEFDAMTQAVMDDFAEDTHVRALSGLLPGDIMAELGTELRASFEAGSPEIISNYIEANYDSIPRANSRSKFR